MKKKSFGFKIPFLLTFLKCIFCVPLIITEYYTAFSGGEEILSEEIVYAPLLFAFYHPMCSACVGIECPCFFIDINTVRFLIEAIIVFIISFMFFKLINRLKKN